MKDGITLNREQLHTHLRSHLISRAQKTRHGALGRHEWNLHSIYEKDIDAFVESIIEMFLGNKKEQ